MQRGDLIWVSGAIDAHGVITGQEYRLGDGDEKMCHTNAQKASCPWRWSIGQQEFMQPMVTQPRLFTDEEHDAVMSWLEARGYVE